MMDEEREFVPYEQAVNMLADGDTIHCYTNPMPSVMVGADWDREEVLAFLKTNKPELAGKIATGMGHALHAGGYWFATKVR